MSGHTMSLPSSRLDAKKVVDGILCVAENLREAEDFSFLGRTADGLFDARYRGQRWRPREAREIS